MFLKMKKKSNFTMFSFGKGIFATFITDIISMFKYLKDERKKTK